MQMTVFKGLLCASWLEFVAVNLNFLNKSRENGFAVQLWSINLDFLLLIQHMMIDLE